MNRALCDGVVEEIYLCVAAKLVMKQTSHEVEARC